MTVDPMAHPSPTGRPRRTHEGRTPCNGSRKPARPRERTDCCNHPECHTDRDANGWWRHVLPDHVASMLADARRRTRLSWNRAAKACGVSRLFIRQVVAGERAPSLDTVDGIADGLRLTGDERELLREYAVRDVGSRGPWGAR